MRFILCLVLLCVVACRGHRGYDGANGTNGTPGIPGSSCTVAQSSNGSVISCEDGTSTVILNGTNGTNGINGQNGVDGTNGSNGQDGHDATPTAYSVVSVVQPCPGTGFREVLLRLYSGQLLAHYSDGSKQFLTFLSPGNYVLTDGSSCHFTVHSDLSVTW